MLLVAPLSDGKGAFSPASNPASQISPNPVSPSSRLFDPSLNDSGGRDSPNVGLSRGEVDRRTCDVFTKVLRSIESSPDLPRIGPTFGHTSRPFAVAEEDALRDLRQAPVDPSQPPPPLIYYSGARPNGFRISIPVRSAAAVPDVGSEVVMSRASACGAASGVRAVVEPVRVLVRQAPTASACQVVAPEARISAMSRIRGGGGSDGDIEDGSAKSRRGQSPDIRAGIVSARRFRVRGAGDGCGPAAPSREIDRTKRPREENGSIGEARPATAVTSVPSQIRRGMPLKARRAGGLPF